MASFRVLQEYSWIIVIIDAVNEWHQGGAHFKYFVLGRYTYIIYFERTRQINVVAEKVQYLPLKRSGVLIVSNTVK